MRSPAFWIPNIFFAHIKTFADRLVFDRWVITRNSGTMPAGPILLPLHLLTVDNPQCDYFFSFIPSHTTPPYFLYSQRSESPSTSSSRIMASPVLLILSNPSRVSSSQPLLPPSLAGTPPCFPLISSITRPVDSQPSARRGRPLLLCLPDRASHSTGFPPSSMPLVMSSLLLMPPSSALVEPPCLFNHPFVNNLKLELATILTDSIISDVHPLPWLSIEYGARGVIFYSPLSPVLHDWEWPLGWEAFFVELYQSSTVTPPKRAVPTGRHRYRDADGNKIIVWVNSETKSCPLCPSFNMRWLFLTAWMFVGLSSECVSKGTSCWYQKVFVKYTPLVADGFVDGSISMAECCVALNLWLGNGYAVHLRRGGSRLRITFDPYNVTPLTLHFR